MVPVNYDLDNHAIILFNPQSQTLSFSIHNLKHLKGERKALSINLNQAEETRKGLVAIVAALTKLEPQLWGWSPSRCEIPLLMSLLAEHTVPFGVLGKNPAPGRGVSYHKEFMEWVWNVMPFYGNIQNLPHGPEEHFERMTVWKENLIQNKNFSKAMKHNSHFISNPDGDPFIDLSNVLHMLAELANEELEEIE
jgi:hypothetical protein